MDTDMIKESEEECKEVLDKAENPAQRAESIINHLVQQTKVYHEDIIKLNKRIEITENEKDIKETLYIKLSEEYKIVLEERDLVKEELDEMRKKVWDLETKIAQQQEDNSSIHYAVCSNAQHIPETNEKICQRLKEKEELLKKQLKEISGKYELTCQENCLLQSKILELNSSIEELKHKHDLEINNLTEGHKETSSKLKTQSRMVLDLEERTKQLSDCNILEQQKYSTKVKELSGELELFEFKSSKNEKEKESIELENMRLNNFISKQQEENEKLKEENRKLIKERGKLSKKIRELEEPNNYEHLIENSMDIKTMISKCGEYKKRFLKEKEQKDKVEKVMKDCIDKISKTVLNDDGKVIDWKRNFKLKKLEVIQKSQQINDLETQNCSLQKEIELKDKAIQNMINLGLTEFCESKEKLPKYSEIKESFEQMGLLETDLKCEKENNSNLKSIIKSRDEQIIELNKELKRLRDKVNKKLEKSKWFYTKL